jgi:hypothetical protein
MIRAYQAAVSSQIDNRQNKIKSKGQEKVMKVLHATSGGIAEPQTGGSTKVHARGTTPKTDGKPALNVKALTDHERAELGDQENIIAEGLQSFTSIGAALVRIRDARLYREHYSTFEAYCRERWDFSKSTANRFISAVEVIHNLESAKVKIVPAVESQVRPLTLLKPNQQRRVWAQVVEEAHGNASEITAGLVSRTVHKLVPNAGRKAPTHSTKGAKLAKGRDSEASKLIRKDYIVDEIEDWFKHKKFADAATKKIVGEAVAEIKSVIEKA